MLPAGPLWCGDLENVESATPPTSSPLASPEIYGLLVFDRGWSGERYEKWLTAILVDQLLPESPTP